MMTFVEDKVQSEITDDLLISTSKLKAYLTYYNNVPRELRQLKDGVHETETAIILVKTLDSGFYSEEKINLLFDESLSFLDQNESTIILIIVLSFLGIVFLAGVVCFYLAKSIASPIEYLAKTVSTE